MTLPSDYTFSKDINELDLQLNDMYRRLREQIDGYTESFDGKIYGSTSAGTATYSLNQCYYVRRGIFVDVFYFITWSGHTGTGDLRIQLPFYEKGHPSSVSISAIRTSNLTYPSGTDYCVLEGAPNEDYAVIRGCRDGSSPQIVQMDAAANISFHHSYIGQIKK